MEVRILILLVSILVPLASGSISILDSTPPDGTIVKAGHSVRMSCRTDKKWFFCLWTNPTGEKQCGVQQDNNTPEAVCKSDPRMQLEMGMRNCDIVISEVSPSDFGQWMCRVVEGEGEFESDKAMVTLEVGQAAKVEFDPPFGAQNQLTITEGETVEIRCAAKSGYPAAQLSWEEPHTTNSNSGKSNLDVQQKPQIIHHSSDHTIDVFHTAVYKADLKDNNREITCVATQLDRNGRNVLYEMSTSIKLKVDKIVLPVDNALTQKIGIISGVLLAIILLILLLVFCCLVICKKRRKRSRPPSSQATTASEGSPDQQIKPIWTTGPANIKAHHAPSAPVVVSHRPHIHQFHDILEPDPYQRRDIPDLPDAKTRSQGTMSTRSTTSQNSWEENRSVGGEEVTVERRISKPSPSLHETHFESEADLPRTVLLHPDPGFYQQTPIYSQPHPRGIGRRPSSSADTAYHPYYPLGSGSQYDPLSGPHYLNQSDPYAGRPTSAMSYVPDFRRMPTPNSQLTTSVKSVFDCDLGCFVELEKVGEEGQGDGEKTQEGNEEDAQQSNESTPSRTSEPKDV